MSDRVGPEDAARALNEIDRRREQVIRREIFPRWWWWAYAVLITELAACVESGRGPLVGTGVAVFVVGSLLVDLPVRRAARAAPPRRGLGGPGAARRTLIGLAAFVTVLVGVGLATGLGLKAAGAPGPGTTAAAVTGVVFAVLGPMLVRWDAAVLVRRSGSRR
jgi:hypothetical protein